MNGLNDIVGQDAKEAGRWFSRPNLLINADFRCPVNQNGQMEYTGNAPWLDMWRSNNCKKVINDGYITVIGESGKFIAQFITNTNNKIEQWLNRKYTLSVLYTDGTLEYGSTIPTANASGKEWITFSTERLKGYLQFGWGNDKFLAVLWKQNDEDLQIVSVKLEEGPDQTHCHKENGVWVLNWRPRYEDELRKCHERYWESEMAFESNTVVENNHLLCNVRFPVAMRTIPKVTILASDKTENAISAWATGAVVLKDVHVNGLTLTKEGFNALYSDSGFTHGITYGFKVRADSNP